MATRTTGTVNANGVVVSGSFDATGASISGVSHTQLTDIGVNTHPQLDSHVSSTANPHDVTSDQVLPTTTKGDLVAYNGSTNVRFGVGTDGQALVANSSTGAGLAWADLQTKNTATTTTSDATATTVSTVGLADQATTLVTVKVASFRTDTPAPADAGAFDLKGAFHRDGATVTQIGLTDLLTFLGANAVGWTASLTINGTDLEIQVTGEAGKTIDWRVDYETVTSA